MAEATQNRPIFETDDPERALVVTYAAARERMALLALLALDDMLAQIPRTTSEPTLGQMRLVWWSDALEALGTGSPPAQPVLQALAREVLARGVSGTELARIARGWEVIVAADTLDDAAITEYAQLRGGSLFACAGTAFGRAADFLQPAGTGWALSDLSRNLSDREASERAARAAEPMLDTALARRWPRSLRALGGMAHLARLNLKAGRDRPISSGAPNRVARLAWHRMTGR